MGETRNTDMLMPGCVRRTGDLAVPDANVVDDTELLFYADAAGEWWGLHARLIVSGPADVSMTVQIGNVDAVGRMNGILYDVAGDAILVVDLQASSGTLTFTPGAALANELLQIDANVKSLATGNVYFRYAKPVGTGDATILENSFMLATRLG